VSARAPGTAYPSALALPSTASASVRMTQESFPAMRLSCRSARRWRASGLSVVSPSPARGLTAGALRPPTSSNVRTQRGNLLCSRPNASEALQSEA
jgi:hypothetical protein